jgi:hypothetical protein
MGHFRAKPPLWDGNVVVSYAHYWQIHGPGSAFLRACPYSAFDRQGQYMNDQPGQSARVLVVDDDPAMRRTLVNYVGDHGMRAMSACGQQGYFMRLIPNFLGAVKPQHN